VIRPDEDGNPIEHIRTKEELEVWINNEEGKTFLDMEKLQGKSLDPNDWRYHNPDLEVLILEVKGIVVPKQKVVEWRLE